MAFIDFKIEGERELNRNINLYQRYMDIEVQSAVEETISFIVEKAKANAPEDTGELKASIEGTVKRISSDILNGYIEVKAPHGAIVEFGTVYIHERPYLVPALEEGISLLERKLRSAHQRACKRLRINP